MKSLRGITAAFAAGILALAISTSANAVTVSNLEDHNVPVSQPVNPTALTASNVLYNLVGSTGDHRTPFDNVGDPAYTYTSVQGGGYGIWSFSSPMLALSLIWGSPDSYNKIEFFSSADGSGSAFATVLNSMINPAGPTALSNALVLISALGQSFQSVKLSSGSNAFEFAGLTGCATDNCRDPAPGETPVPGAALLMGSVLAGGAGFGAWRRRRSKVAA